ncbi:hypothetical protein FH972_022084 [Carpinus fangiana]|uniref:Zn(2)-C6 fungal-type domain-containing protein n=1 Tax=Carpinus fangiana TaxID=176857 RepID=A0A5N6KRJ9_9ROSI|nr:hypothetical protein FH972_022084 [Carpinus fangiana]
MERPKKAKPPNDKKRVRTGCLTCRKRRIKCDERLPACVRCSKGRRECVYDPHSKPESPSPTLTLRALSNYNSLPEPWKSTVLQKYSSNLNQGSAQAKKRKADSKPAQSDWDNNTEQFLDPALVGKRPRHMASAVAPHLQHDVSRDAGQGDGENHAASSEEPITPETIQEIKDLYAHEYARGIDDFFETKWYSKYGMQHLLGDDRIKDMFAGMVELFRNTTDSSFEVMHQLPSTEARTVWELMLMARKAATNPGVAPAEREELQPVVARLAIFEHLVTAQQIEDGQENRDILYSIAVARHLGGKAADFPHVQPDTPIFGLNTTDKNRLLVAKKFLEDEAATEGTDQVVQRICGMAVRNLTALLGAGGASTTRRVPRLLPRDNDVDEAIGIALRRIHLRILAGVLEALVPAEVDLKVVLVGQGVVNGGGLGHGGQDLLAHLVHGVLHAGALLDGKRLERDPPRRLPRRVELARVGRGLHLGQPREHAPRPPALDLGAQDAVLRLRQHRVCVRRVVAVEGAARRLEHQQAGDAAAQRNALAARRNGVDGARVRPVAVEGVRVRRPADLHARPAVLRDVDARDGEVCVAVEEVLRQARRVELDRQHRRLLGQDVGCLLLRVGRHDDAVVCGRVGGLDVALEHRLDCELGDRVRGGLAGRPLRWALCWFAGVTVQYDASQWQVGGVDAGHTAGLQVEITDTRERKA